MQKTVSIPAKALWFNTGLVALEGCRVQLDCQSGQWTANPEIYQGYGANGCTLTAKPGYALPGVPEGALVGRIGTDNSKAFLVGDHYDGVATASGDLYLAINDDVAGRYGKGYTDNQGTLAVAIELSVQPLPRTASAATVAASMALENVVVANAEGTFAVGGVLVGKDGTVYAWQRNRVVEAVSADSYVVNDPTAHGERQLINWYYDNQEKLPPASELTIITSLDPCAMCCGAILTAGINVAVSAHDTYAGVDYAGNQQFLSVPADIRDDAKREFTYLNVEGQTSFSPNPNSIFYGQFIPGVTAEQSLKIFTDGVQAVRDRVSGGAAPAPGDNIALTPPDSPARRILAAYDPDSLAVQLNPPTVLSPALVDVMAKKAKASFDAHNDFDAAALIDPFGNVLISIGNQCGSIPVNSPFVLLTRAYAAARREARSAGVENNLPHPRYCRIVLYYGPGREGPDLMMLGAYGSTMEGQLPAGNTDNFQYFLERQTQPELDAMIAGMPPFYTDKNSVNIQLPQVADQALVQYAAAKAKQA